MKDNLAAPYVKGGGKQTLGFGKKGAEKSKSAKPNAVRNQVSDPAGWPFKAPHADMQARARGAVNPDGGVKPKPHPAPLKHGKQK